MSTPSHQSKPAKRGASDAGQYFRYMSEFVGFTAADAEVIKETRFVIEKHIPSIVAKFYTHLLEYPPTRKYFLKKDGSIDQEYLQFRMHHLTNFWRRTASGVFDDDYASYVDYVGRVHTSRGADPKIYIPERYVIGQVGFVQHAVSEALRAELHDIDAEFEARASKAWHLLLMVILEMLSRAYSHEREAEAPAAGGRIDPSQVAQLAIDTYERNLGLYRSIEHRDMVVARAEDIPDGERKIVQVEDHSIGVFHHKGQWYALRNQCLHRGGPVCTGRLVGDTITCPWHGYQYDVTDGRLLSDASAALETYPVEVREGEIHLQVPIMTWDTEPVSFDERHAQPAAEAALRENEFRIRDVAPGQTTLVRVDGEEVAVYNVAGAFYATQNECTHARGPLNEGELEGECIVCPWHGSRFDVTDGRVLGGPATDPLKTYRVTVEGEIGRVE